MFCFLFCAIWLIPFYLNAVKNDVIPKLKTGEFEYNENLTRGYSGFGQMNWRSIGVGINIKPLVFIRNFNTSHKYKNLHKNLNMDYVTEHGDQIHNTKHEYETYLAGYIFNLDKSFYPFVGGGINMERRVWEIHNDDALASEESIYTIQEKYKTTPSGVIGLFYQLSGYFYLEANLQVYPVLPYLGFGFIEPSNFSWITPD